MKYIGLLVTLMCYAYSYTKAQGSNPILSATDNEYITNLSDRLTIRTLASRKIIGYQVGRKGSPHEAEYSPNDVTSIGLGFTYKFLGINANFRLPLLNNDDNIYGKTKSIDFATYLYLRKFTIDLFAQIYKGHYLSDNDLINSRPANMTYTLRPDLHTQFYGANAHYIFNHQRFSYRASFLQNEWQKQSAGSFLAGINMHYIRAKADSAIVPAELNDPSSPQVINFSRTGVFSLGLDAGYAHTFVFHQHWFTTLALMAGAGVNNSTFNTQLTNTTQADFGLHLNGTIRLAAGYNSEKWFAGIHYVNFLNRNYSIYANNSIWQQSANGLYRIVIARRLSVK